MPHAFFLIAGGFDLLSFDLLRCPHCRAAVDCDEKTLFCKGERRHSFDIAKEGYVNLSDAKASGGGDDALLIGARVAFLGKGHYRPFCDRVISLLWEYASGKRLLDAGCGEGYYTNHMARAGFSVLGVDLSKRGVRAAAKAAKQQGSNATFAVAGVFDLPVPDASLDAVVSLFAPVAQAEFLRVLKPGGILLVAGAGRDHLLDLKQVLYREARPNLPRADLPHDMEKLCEEKLAFQMALEGEDIVNLFAMTPYYYRTPRESHLKLQALPSLSCRAEMDIFVYRKSK